MKMTLKGFKQNPWLWIFVILGTYFLIRVSGFSSLSWDDPELVFSNPDVIHSQFFNVWKRSYQGMYMPLTMSVYILEYSLFKAWAGGYHMVSWLLHLCNALLLFNILKRIPQLQSWSGFLMCLFAFHPVQLENAIWIGEFKTLLSGFFILLCAKFFLTYLQTASRTLITAIVLLFFASLLSKPQGVFLPCILLFFLPKQKPNRALQIRLFIALALISVLCAFSTYTFQLNDRFINQAHQYEAWKKIGLSGWALFNYLKHFIVPVQLSALYTFPNPSPFVLFMGYCVWILLSISGFWMFLKNKKTGLLGLCTFLLPLLPVLQFIPFGEALWADRYLYLSLVGLGIISLLAMQRLTKKHVTFLQYCFIACIIGSSCYYLPHWKSDLNVYTRVLTRDPQNLVALNSLGVEYTRQGESKKAMNCFRSAEKINPKNYKVYYNSGLLFLKINQNQKAVLELNKCLQLYNYTKAYTARGTAYLQMGDWPKALADFNTSIRMDSLQFKPWLLLADCHHHLNQLPQAEREYTKALSINPYSDEVYFKRGLCLAKQNQLQRGLLDIQKAIEMMPESAQYYYWSALTKIALHLDPCADLHQALNLKYSEAQPLIQKYCN